MSLRSAAATCVRTVGACVAIVGVALGAFLALPESLLYNDYVSGAILGSTILLVSGAVRVSHSDADGGRPTGSER